MNARARIRASGRTLCLGFALARTLAPAFAFAFALGLAFATAAHAEASRLRLGFFPNITHAQALYARAGGEFERAIGVPIEWSSFNAGPTAIEALFADAVDMTFVGPNPAINGYVKSRGGKFVVVAGAASGGAALVVREDAGIATEKDFDNKIVATPQIGNTQDVAARLWFETHGYKLKEKGGRLTLLALANPDQLTMFRKKQIHAAWTVEPWVARLEIEGGGKIWLDERTLWPDGRYVTTQLVVGKAFLATNPELVRAFLAAHVEVTEAINRDKKAAAGILNMQLQKETGKPLLPEVLDRALERVEFTWDPIASSLRESAQAAHRVGLMRQPPDLTGIYALEPLNEVLAARGLPAVQD